MLPVHHSLRSVDLTGVDEGNGTISLALASLMDDAIRFVDLNTHIPLGKGRGHLTIYTSDVACEADRRCTESAMPRGPLRNALGDAPSDN